MDFYLLELKGFIDDLETKLDEIRTLEKQYRHCDDRELLYLILNEKIEFLSNQE